MKQQREEDKAKAAAERQRVAKAKHRRKAEREAARRQEERQMLALYKLEQEEARANKELQVHSCNCLASNAVAVGIATQNAYLVLCNFLSLRIIWLLLKLTTPTALIRMEETLHL